MDFIDEHGYRANVGMIVTDGRGQVLIAGRRGQTGWQFPQGGVRPDEPIANAMYRELREEVGLEPDDVDVVGTTRDWLRYRLPKRYIRRDSNPRCIGQKQRWFLLKLLSDPAALRFDLSEQPEFDRCRWVDYWQPVMEVIYFKRRVYEQALTELSPLAFPDSQPSVAGRLAGGHAGR